MGAQRPTSTGMQSGAAVGAAGEPVAVVPTTGVRHLALRVLNLEATTRFYRELFGMRVVWEPDPDNVYLSSGSDNLALHRVTTPLGTGADQRLDHLGFFVGHPQAVRDAGEALRERGVTIVHPARQHRDGSWSLYCLDPDGNTVQILYDPNTNP